jgi:hypothetical protein
MEWHFLTLPKALIDGTVFLFAVNSRQRCQTKVISSLMALLRRGTLWRAIVLGFSFEVILELSIGVEEMDTATLA